MAETAELVLPLLFVTLAAGGADVNVRYVEYPDFWRVFIVLTPFTGRHGGVCMALEVDR